jgi:hypothetical protein
MLRFVKTNRQERDHQDEQGANGSIILNWIPQCGDVEHTYLGQGRKVAGFLKIVREDQVGRMEYSTWMSNYQILKLYSLI